MAVVVALIVCLSSYYIDNRTIAITGQITGLSANFGFSLISRVTDKEANFSINLTVRRRTSFVGLLKRLL